MEFIKKLFLNDSFIISIILINSALLFWMCYPNAPRWLSYADSLFTVLFVIEMNVKISKYGFKKYIKSRLNQLDFVVTIISIPSLFQVIFPNGIIASFDIVLVFRTLRVFRTFRALKPLMIIRYIPGIDRILRGVKNGVRASYLIVFAFSIFLLIISLITCSLFSSLAPDYFGNPLESLYSTFRLFTIEGWYEIPAAICHNMNSNFLEGLVDLYFVIVLFCGGILGMSFVNSIIVDAMASDNNEEVLKGIRDMQNKIDELSKKIDK